MPDAQHQELTSFLSRLVSDEHAPDLVHDVAARVYEAMFEPDAEERAVLMAANDAVWATLERTGYRPPGYVLG